MILFTAEFSALGSVAMKLLAAITVRVVKSTMDGAAIEIWNCVQSWLVFLKVFRQLKS